MRIPSGKTDQNIYFVAVDSTDLKTRKTGLTSFTVYRSRNSGTATVYTTPTITELSAANMPGVYSLLIDEDTTIASTSDAEEYAVHITQASMAPVTRVLELFRRDTTSGQQIAVTSGVVAAVIGAGGVGTGAITSGSFAAGAINAAAIAADAITDAKVAADVTIASVTGSVGSVTGSVASVTGNVGGNVVGSVASVTGNVGGNVTGSVGSIAAGGITANSFAAGAITAAKFAANALDAVWSTATRVLTAGTNIVLAKGTGVTGFNDLDASGVRGAVGLASANLDTQLATFATAANLTTVNNNVVAVNTKLGAPAGASVSADIAAIKSDTGAVKAKTDNLPAAPAAVGDIPTANQNADALLDRASGIEAGLTPRQGFRLWSAALLGKASGMTTATAVFRNTTDTKDRIVASVDADGNRLGVTLDAS